MIDIDETMERIYKNPFEAEPKPVYACRLCGRGIYHGDVYIRQGSKSICSICISKRNK
ncbi:MAG: hypothetical protein AB1Z23_01985 [Eubacteriales bacterium]